MSERGMLATVATVLMLVSVMVVTKVAVATQLTSVPDATFRSLDGTPVPLADLRETVVLLNFWGTWCVPCLQEIPELVRLSHQFKAQGVAVVGVAVDSGHPDDIRIFMSEHGMDYSNLIGELSLVKRRFHVIGFPTSLLIDRQGLIHKRYFGPQTFEILKHDVELLLQHAP
ncbi:MAG: TlpA family protein disulfide reductase [Nitrospirales bacterium]|nr:TlpA family protein disulfide reductase [Nitrospirales bacterium]